MKKFNYLLLAATFLLIGKSQAQDFHLSQYDAAALNFNPAMTGLFKGKYRIHGHYRNQWSAVATKPYTTGLIAFDMPINKFGLGVQAGNFRAGAGNYNVFSLLVSGSYDFKLDDNNYHHISVGAQGGFFQKSVNQNKLTFGTQYTTANGGGYNTAISNGESFGANSFLTHDANAGIIYYYGKETSKLNPFIGVTAYHLSQPSETFFSADNKLPMRYVGHLGTKINVNNKWQFLPKAIYMRQENAQEMTFSVHAHYYIQSSDAILIFGPTYRNKDAAIFEAGIQFGKFIYRMSYDFNTSSLNTSSNGRGGLEMSLTFIQKKLDPNPIPTCPRL